MSAVVTCSTGDTSSTQLTQLPQCRLSCWGGHKLRERWGGPGWV